VAIDDVDEPEEAEHRARSDAARTAAHHRVCEVEGELAQQRDDVDGPRRPAQGKPAAEADHERRPEHRLGAVAEGVDAVQRARRTARHESMQLQFTVESGSAQIDDLLVDPFLLKS
jgi:hypothetical protein